MNGLHSSHRTLLQPFLLRGAARRRGGSILVAVYVLTIVMLMMSIGMISIATFQARDRGRYEIYKDEFAAAEEALNQTFAHVQFLVRQNEPSLTTIIKATPPPTVKGFDLLDFELEELSAGISPVQSGQWAGMDLYNLRYRVYVHVRKMDSTDRFDHPGVRLAQSFEISYIPLFNFAIFYDPDMEIAPGPTMEVNGRVHCNSDAYFQANSGLTFRDKVTVAGSIYHGRHPDAGQSASNGKVNFRRNAAGALAEMARSSGDENRDGWLDARDADWQLAAAARWDGYVRDKSHNVMTLTLPVPPVVDPHVIIERAIHPDDDAYVESVEKEKFENKAGVKIHRDALGNITAEDHLGNPIPLEYHLVGGTAVPGPGTPSQTKSVVSTSRIYDFREQKYVNILDIDISKMLEYPQIVPPNGVLFATSADSGDELGAVRLINGSRLPTATDVVGFTVATDTAIYVKGNYNTVNRTLAMVAGDAMYALSNSWNDTNSDSPYDSFSKRRASDTTMNVVVMNGIVPSASRTYSGGVENYFRFLENWDSRKYTFSGSIIQLWESTRFLGPWGRSNVYTAPQRPWSWDTALAGIDGPPGTPRVVEFLRTEWEVSF